MDRFSRLCLWGAMACAFLSLALLSFDVFPWFRDPVLPHRPTYPLGIAGMALFILSGQWRGRMKEHLLLLGGILATVWGLQDVPGDVAPDVWTGFLLWTAIPLAFWLWWAVMLSCLPCGQGGEKALPCCGVAARGLEPGAYPSGGPGQSWRNRDQGFPDQHQLLVPF